MGSNAIFSGRFPLAALLLWLVLLMQACFLFQPKPPPEPNVDLLAEDFGCGISLLQPERDARNVTGINGLEVRVRRPEDLLLSNPYTDKPEGKSLLIAVVSEASGNRDGGDDYIGSVVSRIMIYLAEGDEQVTIDGRPLAGFTPADIKDWLGISGSVTAGRDGNIHTRFQFTVDPEHKLAGSVVSSHGILERCFALDLRLEPELEL